MAKNKVEDIQKPKQSIYLDSNDVNNIPEFKVNEKVVVKRVWQS